MATPNKPPTANPRQAAFARLRLSGMTQAEAYRAIYQPNAKPKTANQAGCKLEAMPAVRAEMERLREKSARKTLLSLNERLGILADIAQGTGDSPAAHNAKARAIEVYSKISGDQAPDRHEVTGKGGGPLQSEATVTASVTATVTRLSVRDRIQLLRKRREAEKASREDVKP